MSPTPEPGSLWQQFNVGCWEKRQKGSTKVRDCRSRLVLELMEGAACSRSTD